MKATPTKLENPALKVNPFVRDFKRHWMLYLMVLPALLHLIVFNYFTIFGLGMAFQDLDFDKGMFTSPFVGFKNFEFLFASTDSWLMTRNTVLYNVWFIAINTIICVAIALVVSELLNKKYSKSIQTLYMMPSFLSSVVVATIVGTFLANGKEGYINKMLMALGKDPVNWYIQVGAWPIILTVIQCWMGNGRGSVGYTAFLTGISREYYEAASIDGASRFQQLWHITVPHLKTYLAMSLISSLSGMFRGNFDLFFLMTKNSGPLYDVTMIIDTYIYNALRNYANINMSLAAGFYQAVVGFILVIITNQIVKSIDDNLALF